MAKLVAFDGDELVEETRTDTKTLEALPTMLSKHTYGRAIVATVADITTEAEALLHALPCPTVRLTPDTPIPLVKNLYRTPHTLGADRLGAVVGAVAQQPSRDVLVIDCGTCITYEFVDSEGCYLGGNISPGLDMRLEALNEKTARLPKVAARGERPQMGHDTETAIRCGVLTGIRYEIEGYIRRFTREHPSLCVFVTGGCRFDFDTPERNPIFADKHLVAKGLNKILEYNT